MWYLVWLRGVEAAALHKVRGFCYDFVDVHTCVALTGKIQDKL